jgi:hypothetical protein
MVMIQLHCDAVEEQANRGSKKRRAGVNRGDQANAHQRMIGLHRHWRIAIEGEQPTAIAPPNGDTNPQCKDDRRGHGAGGAASGLPFAEVGHVAHHGPQHRDRSSRKQTGAELQADDRHVAVAGKKNSAIQQRPVSNMLQKKSGALAYPLGQAVEQATPTSSEINPKPLNQLKSQPVAGAVFKVGQHDVAANEQRGEVEDA